MNKFKQWYQEWSMVVFVIALFAGFAVILGVAIFGMNVGWNYRILVILVLLFFWFIFMRDLMNLIDDLLYDDEETHDH